MARHILSKSSYIRGQQCPKALFLFKYYPQMRDPIPAERQAIFARGHSVGKIARDLFPGGTDVSPKKNGSLEESVRLTAELIESGAAVIYEASFVFDGILVMLDILVREEDGWKAYEVKSSSRVTNVYVQDAALQYYVIAGTGLQLTDFSIVYVNTDYVREGALELDKLFCFRSVLPEVQQMRSSVGTKAGALKKTLELPQVPDQPIGEHCFSPYPCDFMSHCWKNLPEGNVFSLSGMSRAEQFALFHSGVKRYEDIPDDVVLPAIAQLQRASLISGGPLVRSEELTAFVASVRYPLSFLDAESFMPAVPVFQKTHPYQHLPFQYSLHICDEAGSEPRHYAFLAEPGEDPRRAFAEQLLRDTEGEGTILVYDDTFERNMLNALKRDFPEWAGQFDQRLSRIADMMQPFLKRWYYHSAMKGSVSLKNVLPALVPGMSYDSLKIASGSHAMSIYEQLSGQTDIFVLAEQKEALFEYGKMDTLAMVYIWEVLCKAVS